MNENSSMARPQRASFTPEAEAAEVPVHQHRTVCPLLTRDKWSLSERENNAVAPPMKAYKLGKERWSYNQLKVEIHDTAQRMRLDPKLAKTIDPKKLPVRQQGYSAAFDLEFTNSAHLKVVFFICYSVPRKIATETSYMYEWDLVTRDHCKNGCPGPILRPIQRLGKLGKRSNVPQTETADPNQTKDPKFVYLSIDECGSHVGNRKTTFFRLIVGAYEVSEAGEALLGTACSEPFTVVRNNDNTEGASYSPIQIPVKRSWGGWALDSVQMHELPHVHLPARKVSKSPNMSTSPLSTNSVVPLYDGSSHAPAGMDALPSHARCLFPEAQHTGFTHLESSRLQQSSAAVVQTGGGAFPLPGSATVQHSHSDCATSGPCRWGGAARRTGRGRAQGDCPRPRAEPPGSFRPYAEYFYRKAGSNLQHSFHSDFQHSMGSFQQGLLGHMQATMQPQRMHEEFGEPARMQPHMESYGAHMHAEYDEPARMGMEAQYTCFKRPRQLATQQSETAEEFRFMLPEQSQGMMHKRARIMDEDHSGLPFACLPAHGLSYTELPGHGSMPFGRSPLPGAGQAGAQLPSLPAGAPQADPCASQRSEAPAGEPAEAKAPYAEDSYQDADKEANVESLQTMLSDPESLAPSLPLEMSFSPDEASNSGQAAEASASAYPAANAALGGQAGAGYIMAEVLGMSTQFLLSTQYLGSQATGLPPLRTCSSGFAQDSWGSQSRSPSAGDISDFVAGPLGVQGQLSIQEEEFVDNILRQEPAADC